MVFFGRTHNASIWQIPENYGKGVAWSNDHRAFQWFESGAGLLPGEGLLILKIQQRILEFLVKCYELILRDFSSNISRERADLTKKEPLHLSSDSNTRVSLASMIAEVPYRIPGRLDLKRLKAIITARRSAAQDHVWALSEDPGYCADTVKDFSNHQCETILNANGESHPLLQTSTFWNRTLRCVITNAYGDFIRWDVLYKQLTSLGELAQSYPESTSWDSKVPQEYLDQLLHFKYHLQQMAKNPIQSLKEGVPASLIFVHFLSESHGIKIRRLLI